MLVVRVETLFNSVASSALFSWIILAVNPAVVARESMVSSLPLKAADALLMMVDLVEVQRGEQILLWRAAGE